MLLCVIVLLCVYVNIYANESLEIQKIFNNVSRYIQPNKKLDILERKSNKFNVKITKTHFNVTFILKKAKDSFKLGDNEKAIAFLKEITTKFPYHKNALMMLSNIYYINQDYKQAKEICIKLLKQYPGDTIILENFFTILLKYNHNLALETMLELYSRHKNYAPLLANLGLLYVKNGDLVNAKEYMLAAVSMDYENPFYLYNLAVILDKLHDLENAAVFYEKLLNQEVTDFNQRQQVEARLQSIKLR
ncbi:hypothetical protein BIY23_02285 [Wolbachia pipientis]|uniref:Uncharacterized protein n=1 Tax=Wolbachia pipientis TaxID=955 RepID=A0A1E7QK07_WOLPI|nr:hypothetical protein BIY23_02285 [Wolbachia pipientis]